MTFCENLKKDLEKSGCSVWVVPKGYKTPATDYALERHGGAELKRSKLSRNHYQIMEGVRGYDFFCLDEKIPLTSLYIDAEEWMVDDPLHWEGMKSLAEKAEGNVLVAGVGLGLVAHALKENPKVKNIDIYDIDKDVITLMQKNLPKDVKIHNKDIFEYTSVRIRSLLKREKPLACHDTIILDIWVGHDPHIKYEMISAMAQFNAACPKAKVFIWGTNDRSMNPSVEKKPCKMVDIIKEERNRRMY